MVIEDFIEQKRVQELVVETGASIQGKQFSDIVDAAGHQYVDLVMEGGGVLGIALLGFTYILEEFGIRFLGIGGTSAGSINALVLAALGRRDEKKSRAAIELLANVDLYSFVDGDEDATDFIDALVEDAGALKLGFKFLQVVDNFQGKLGLCPGRAFQNWLTRCLATHDVHTTKDLLDVMNQIPPGFGHREGQALTKEQQDADLAIVAAEITTETKVQFPKMAHLFWEDVENVSPALYAPASMSIPFFFQPFRVKQVPQSPQRVAEWRKPDLANYHGEIPKDCVFIDGGIMSNFPIDVFHVPYAVPSAPTFGVKLGVDREAPCPVTSPFSLGISIFNSARHTLDYDFIKRNPDYRHLVSTIDTGSHNWIDFRMPDKSKINLFTRGVECGARFLKKFDWLGYKRIRADLVKAYQRPQQPL